MVEASENFSEYSLFSEYCPAVAWQNEDTIPVESQRNHRSHKLLVQAIFSSVCKTSVAFYGVS